MILKYGVRLLLITGMFVGALACAQSSPSVDERDQRGGTVDQNTDDQSSGLSPIANDALNTSPSAESTTDGSESVSNSRTKNRGNPSDKVSPDRNGRGGMGASSSGNSR